MNNNGKLKIELKSIILKNFKGIKDLTINFNHVTNISGDNATGKTTVKDAYTWLLFDKDSTDRKNFEIKTLDKDNKVIPGLEHSVTGILLIDGKEKSFQKIYKEKWPKKRGEADALFTGHETLYYVNEVPVKQSDYNNEVYSIIYEILFKMITDPLYFSSKMKWEERRGLLFNMFDHISVDDILTADKSLLPLKDELAETSIQDLKKKYSAQKRKLNDDLKAIPFRIDECNNSIIPTEGTDEGLLIQKQSRLNELDSQLTSFNTPLDNSVKDKLNKIRTEILKIEQEHENKIAEQKREIDNKLLTLQNTIKNIYRDLDFAKSRSKVIAKDIELYGNQVDLFLNQWHEEKEKPFIINEDFVCPTCLRPLDPGTVETKKQDLLKNFNQDKANRLTQINNRGKDARVKLDATNKEAEENNKVIASKNRELEKLNIQLEKAEKEKSNFDIAQQKTLTKAFDYGRRYFELKDELDQMQVELVDNTNTDVSIINKITVEKKTLQQEIETIKSDLHQEETNKKQKARITELGEQERKLAQQVADIEKKEFLCEKFIKTEVELLESSINKKFRHVRFKLFDTQINGGITETCKPLINGVPFIDANHAGQINAGLDIINALSEHYKISAPIIIDNREAINDIIETQAQVVNLVVTKDKTLKVN